MEPQLRDTFHAMNQNIGIKWELLRETRSATDETSASNIFDAFSNLEMIAWHSADSLPLRLCRKSPNSALNKQSNTSQSPARYVLELKKVLEPMNFKSMKNESASALHA